MLFDLTLDLHNFILTLQATTQQEITIDKLIQNNAMQSKSQTIGKHGSREMDV